MEKLFVSFATATARIAGKPWTFLGCVLIVLIWAASGPIFKFSETWQLVINTGTTIITFLMVFQPVRVVARTASPFSALRTAG
ncbi:low affinity iron permease family protein [Brevundimonas sp. TWP2-3-4b2]|uniref:low affinity iron permease family protein n=1 Tax=Brevundimonas sp. TWP2-3-4b2 TaxID=2804595 RepID=UPI003CFB5D31